MKYLELLRKRNLEKNCTYLQSTLGKNEIGKIKHVDANYKKSVLNKTLQVAYIMNHTRICGGAKIIIEHTNYLVERGHEVFIISKDTIPDWIEVKAKFIQIPVQSSHMQFIPNVDVVVCTVINQLPECYALGGIPVVLFEQGDTYIYEFEKLQETMKTYFKNMWQIPVPILSVSKALSKEIFTHFGRESHVLHNSLDSRFFYQRENNKQTKNKLRILYVGNEDIAFKGIHVIRDALSLVREAKYDFEEVWATPVAPRNNFNGELIVKPTQEQLGEIYRSCDIFISGSFYESLPLPPMEAMACGCAVVTTNNAGVLEYARHEQNSLIGEIGNPESLAKHIISLMNHPEKMQKIIQGGYETVKQFQWDKIIDDLESYLSGVIDFSQKKYDIEEIPTVRVERLENNWSNEKIEGKIKEVQSTMEEDWCLWLMKGEVINEKFIEQLPSILSRNRNVELFFQVLSKDIIDGYQHMRLEKRLLKRGQLFNEQEKEAFIVVPSIIKENNNFYFTSNWLSDIICSYKNEDFDKIPKIIKKEFQKLSDKDKVIASKWGALSFIKMQKYKAALNLLDNNPYNDYLYSDLTYIRGHIHYILGNEAHSEELIRLAQYMGNSHGYSESFYDIDSMCEEFININSR